MKILIAEDDKVTQRMLQRTLENLGHEVVATSDGREALERFDRDPDEFQFVITDWEMPHVKGPEVIRKIRENGGTRYVFVVLLTAKAESADLVEGMEAGADDFMTKPFKTPELRVRLEAGERVLRLEERLASQNDAMRRDLEAAAQVQSSLLPQTPPEVEGFRFAFEYVPSTFVAGDILNIHRLDETHVGLYVLDVSGHGVPAAMLSVTLSRVLEPIPGHDSIVKRWKSEEPHYEVVRPADVVADLNQRFPMESQSNLYHTVIYGVIDTAAKTLTVSRAGHPHMIRVRGGHGEVVESLGGPPAGMVGSIDYEQSVIPLEPGDRIYFHSDGLNEAVDESEEMYGVPRLVEALARGGSGDLAGSISGALTDVQGFACEGGLDDDLTLLGFEME